MAKITRTKFVFLWWSHNKRAPYLLNKNAPTFSAHGWLYFTDYNVLSKANRRTNRRQNKKHCTPDRTTCWKSLRKKQGYLCIESSDILNNTFQKTNTTKPAMGPKVLLRAHHPHPPMHLIPLNHSVNQREQRKIPTQADVFPGMVLRAALAHENCSGTHSLSAVTFDAQILTTTVPSVPRWTLCSMMRHNK